jgi:hypothetical protein
MRKYGKAITVATLSFIVGAGALVGMTPAATSIAGAFNTVVGAGAAGIPTLMAAGALGGFVSGGITTGSLKGAIRGAIFF